MNRTDTHRLLDVLDDPTFQPQGSVTVTIRDEHTGRIKSQETRPNFVSKTWKAWARARLRVQWMAFGYNSQFTGQTAVGVADAIWPGTATNSAANGGRSTMPVLPDTHIGCWNQTSAEDAANEHSPVVPATGLVAWASRHPFSPAAGSRGAIDVAESNISDLEVHNVFNWLTSQGNGTFQSVGWLGLGAPGVHRSGFGINFRRRLITAALTSASHITGATTLYFGGGWIDPADGKFYTIVGRQSNATIRILSFDFSGLNDSAANTLGVAADVTGLAPTNESIEDIPTSHTATAIADPHSFKVIGRDGTNTIFCYPTNTTENLTHRWGKIGASGASTSYVPASGTAVGALSGAVLGGFAYLGSASDATPGVIYKHTIATGALSATLTLDANVAAACLLGGAGASPCVKAMTTDGTDLIVVYGSSGGGLNTRHIAFRITTAGVMTQIIGLVPAHQTSGQSTEAVTGPYVGTGTYSYVGNVFMQPSIENLMAPTTAVFDQLAVTSQTVIGGEIILGLALQASSGANQYLWYDGALYFCAMGSNTIIVSGASMTMSANRQGFDLGSRVLLGAPNVKTGSDFMKIEYDIALPGWH